MAVRVGIDLVSVEEVASALVGPLCDRYLRRIYTDGEIAACRTVEGVDAGALAARFAAKEATLKVMAAEDFGISLRDIEVVETPRKPRLRLHGPAAEWAADVGLTDLALSVACDRHLAMAFVSASIP
jgi:holo-[acyl-carrier protein] synthase